MKPASVLIVDDHPVVRHGLRTMLSTVPDLRVAGEAGSGAAALRAIEGGERPDVVLLDLRLPGADGISVARQLRRAAPEARIVILTMHDEPAQAARALEAGADGYVLKSAGLDQLAGAIRRVLRGERVVAPELVPRLLGDYAAILRQRTRDDAALSGEELAILDGVAQGRSYRELAHSLHLSEITVRRRVQDVYRKLDVGDRAHAVAVAIRRGLM